jgi:hypothetical protein
VEPKFKPAPSALPEPLDEGIVERFVAGAPRRTLRARDPRREKPTSGINLRLNDYELELVRRVAAAEGKSIQRTIKELLIPALEARARAG